MTADADYPAHLLARAPAPPYTGEGPFALWHYSEDPSLGRFRPRAPAADPRARPLVWAVDTRHAPMFWFPRDCPRGCIWPGPGTTPADRERFFGQSAASRVHVTESGWLGRVRDCRLYAYRLPAGPFRPHEATGGYWVCGDPVDATERLGGRRSLRPPCRGRHRTAGHALDLAVLAAGGGLDRRVQRVPAAQQRTAPGPDRVEPGRLSSPERTPTEKVTTP